MSFPFTSKDITPILPRHFPKISIESKKEKHEKADFTVSLKINYGWKIFTPSRKIKGYQNGIDQIFIAG